VALVNAATNFPVFWVGGGFPPPHERLKLLKVDCYMVLKISLLKNENLWSGALKLTGRLLVALITNYSM
jgi:hypothetical protein